MASDLPDGECSLCGEMYTKQGMTNHLKSCRQDHIEGEQDTFHLAVEGAYRPSFWIHLEISAETTLMSLDSFLRDLWLECCGHMSAFSIGQMRYSAQPMGHGNERGMDVRLAAMLTEEAEFTYEYDFGTVTELSLRVVQRTDDHCGCGLVNDYGGDPVELLARNELPELVCGFCGDTATQVCSVDSHDPEGWCCDSCIEKHGCEPRMFLPVVNSPRVGKCAYSG